MSSLVHRTHPHPLRYVDTENDFVCDGCGTFGSGERYRCRNCDFDLHTVCATCPTDLSSFIHRHPLKLTIERWRERACLDRKRPCVVCEEQVQGLYYRCIYCDDGFFLHPVCSTIPSEVHHVLDRRHPLKFQVASLGVCDICDNICAGRYRCGPCRINIHVECITKPCVNSSPSPSRGGGGCTRGPVRRQQQQQQQQQQRSTIYADGMPSNFQGSGGGGNTSAPNESETRRMFRAVGNIAATLAVSAVFGVPISISPFSK